MTVRPFRQVDVFGSGPLGARGNPVAVVHDADDLDDDAMAAFARWTNLSETTFLLAPSDPTADYRVRIWTPGGELPFAGHPTLGSAHAWLEAGGVPRDEGVVVQECGVGPVRLRRDEVLSFAAPLLLRSGPVEPEHLDRILAALSLTGDDVLDAAWLDNGPGWIGVLLRDAATVLALRPDLPALGELRVGVAGLHGPDPAAESAADPAEDPTADPAEDAPAVEVRAFVPSLGVGEDPVTGSLNAGLGQWLAGRVLPQRYVAAQGTVLGRAGRVLVERRGDDVWVGGTTVSTIVGQVRLGAGPVR
ncbi:PhzF family phenazine biosynthesis protein [Nocardioides sp. TRM66260-LWL]|uniref:PhzF family phenazine biosynthesis protein n=1 Tax=Nocardioides sp. TRM66260-LWL TaxID=2874478 RepID=UPI001CC7446A|nr:PhzF family phenazine biosynthesis protein [Nocardioides sp. TRM66260-LWL]MBZ5733755.1 PhzF family phenazine biosynthesis protein [Nocardioides sp. TRM66260-LWL]